jgi:hypothetical protein
MNREELAEIYAASFFLYDLERILLEVSTILKIFDLAVRWDVLARRHSRTPEARCRTSAQM